MCETLQRPQERGDEPRHGVATSGQAERHRAVLESLIAPRGRAERLAP